MDGAAGALPPPFRAAFHAGHVDGDNDPDAEERVMRAGGVTLCIRQHPRASGAARYLSDAAPRIEWPQDDDEDDSKAAAAGGGGGGGGGASKPDLSNVGLVVWTSGFVLAELLLRARPLGPWPGVRVLELGCGTGACGLFLAAAGAQCVLTDRPHIVPLARANAAANCGAGGAGPRPLVVEYEWGEPAAALYTRVAEQQQQPQGAGGAAAPAAIEFDAIVLSDVVYEPSSHAALLASVAALASPHTRAFLAYKRRGLGEEGFEAAAAAAGWAVLPAAEGALCEEFRDSGEFRVVSLVQHG